jgi:hypothetical protein
LQAQHDAPGTPFTTPAERHSQLNTAAGGLVCRCCTPTIGPGRIDGAIEFGDPQQREAMVIELDIIPLLSRGIHMHHCSDWANRQLLWVTRRDTIADLEAHRSHYQASFYNAETATPGGGRG